MHPHICFSGSAGCSRWVLCCFHSSPSDKREVRAWNARMGHPCASPGRVLSALLGLQIFQRYVVAEVILLLFRERTECYDPR